MEMIKPLPPLEEMHIAFSQRDASYDGVFFAGVRSTGIFCRPSCPARKPLAENIEYFATADEALLSGYRPCKRCHPLDVTGTPPDWVETLLKMVESAPDPRMRDTDLRQMGIDPTRARRYFLKHYGMTFQAYCRGRRLGESLNQIHQGTPLDEVALGNGYESHSGFRDAFGRTFGMPPGQAQDTECIFTELIESPLGPLVAGATSAGICLLEFSDPNRLERQFRALRRRLPLPTLPGGNPHLQVLRQELAAYFTGDLTTFSLPLVCPGSVFQEKVWQQLQRIPYGETRCYEQLAQEIGSPQAARAVGTANGWNRIAILIPCHRVVSKNGQLGGYGGGKWRKQWLLDLERQHVAPH